MTDERWTKIWEAFTGDPMDPKNNTEAGLRRVVELLDGTPAPQSHVKPSGYVKMTDPGEWFTWKTCAKSDPGARPFYFEPAPPQTRDGG